MQKVIDKKRKDELEKERRDKKGDWGGEKVEMVWSVERKGSCSRSLIGP